MVSRGSPSSSKPSPKDTWCPARRARRARSVVHCGQRWRCSWRSRRSSCPAVPTIQIRPARADLSPWPTQYPRGPPHGRTRHANDPANNASARRGVPTTTRLSGHRGQRARLHRATPCSRRRRGEAILVRRSQAPSHERTPPTDGRPPTSWQPATPPRREFPRQTIWVQSPNRAAPGRCPRPWTPRAAAPAQGAPARAAAAAATASPRDTSP